MNWGTKLILAMGLFMAFILVLSLKMVFSNEDDLIEKDYYEKGLNYDKKYNSEQQAIQDSVVPAIDVNNNGLSISFVRPATCTLNFKRLSDAKMDTTFARNTDENFVILVQPEVLKSGPWRLSLTYTIDSKTYMLEREIKMP